MSAESFGRFLLYALEPRAATGGWIDIIEMSKILGVSRATAYRYVSKAEACGLAIIRDEDENGCGRPDSAGFRCLMQTARRPEDHIAVAQRRKPRKARGRTNRTV